MKKTEQIEIFAAIQNERKYQDKKWGHVRKDLPAWLLVMEAELAEAKEAWVKNKGPADMEALQEVLQVVACGVACLEDCGLWERPAGSFMVMGIDVPKE